MPETGRVEMHQDRLMYRQRVTLQMDALVLEVRPTALVVETADGRRLCVPRGGLTVTDGTARVG